MNNQLPQCCFQCLS